MVPSFLNRMCFKNGSVKFVLFHMFKCTKYLRHTRLYLAFERPHMYAINQGFLLNPQKLLCLSPFVQIIEKRIHAYGQQNNAGSQVEATGHFFFFPKN